MHMKEARMKKLHITQSKYTTFWKIQNYVDSKVNSGCQGFWEKEEGINRWNTGNFQGYETILHDLAMVGT